MLHRPKLGETEEDLLRQQEEFLKASGKESQSKRKVTKNEEEEEKNKSKKFEVVGDITERKMSKIDNSLWELNIEQSKGFPKLFAVDCSLTSKKKGKKSLFAMQVEKSKKIEVDENMSEEFVSTEPEDEIKTNISNVAFEVHEENVKKLSRMSEEEIMEEQKKLLNSLDPNLVRFLKDRKKNKVEEEQKMDVDVGIREVDEEEVKKNVEKYLDSRWINLDFVEKEKLEWIGDIPDKKSLEPDQPYSARFDFKGELQPFSTEIDVRNSLYHHGDEPNRPGYTIQELYQLSRSQVLQQRILALNTLANITRKTKLGYYDKCFDGQLLHKLVESDLFFLLRFSIDDNPLIPAAVNCLHNLICNESDEFCLDKLLGVLYVDEQPLLCCKIEAKKEEEKELKDHVLISCDMVKGIIRTDLLVRLAYVLNTFAPNRETVTRVINCLIRTSRHSLEAANKIFETNNLLSYVYAKINSKDPVYEGVKLFRILCSYSKEFTTKITQSFDFQFLVSFIEAEENINITKKDFYLLKLESMYFWRGLLLHDLYINEFVMWSPCLIRLLLFYTQKVDVSDSNDFDFELFSAITSLLIVCNKKKVSLESNVIVMMRICLEKWLTQLIQTKKYNFAVSKALGTAFRYFTSYYKIYGVTSSDLDFTKKINCLLVTLLQSEVFFEMCKGLRKHSHLLNLSNVTRDPDNLPSLCSVYDGGEEFLKIIQNSSSFPFFISFVKYLKAGHRISNESILVVRLFLNNTEIQKYLKKVEENFVENYNWFMKYETNFLTNLLRLLALVEMEVLQMSFRLLPLVRVDDKNSKKLIKIICDKNNWGGCEFIDHLGSLYCDFLLESSKSDLGVINYTNDLVPEDWLYKILTNLRGKEAVVAVSNILKFICLILQKSADFLIKIAYTFRFYHVCAVFLTDSNVFDTSIQNSLEQIFDDIIANKEKINLNIKYEKNKSFYDLYTELITQYAGVSYGLPVFGKFVLFPLQNRFSMSFRKLIWFEYSHVLRVLTLPYPNPNFISLKDFVNPCETDESLLVAYMNSVSNGVISKKRNPFVYFVAIGNVKMFLDSENQDAKLSGFLRKKAETIQNEELKNDFFNFSL